MTLQAFHSDPSIKANLVASLISHREQDAFVRCTYGEVEGGKFRGCGVGCTIQSLSGNEANFEAHGDYPEIAGLPEWLARLQDYCFEEMSGDYASFSENLMQAIPVGANLDAAQHRIMARVQREVTYQPSKHNEAVAALHDRQASGDNPTDEEWSAAESAAWSDAWSDVESAAESAARSAAWSAARSAARSAEESAARSAEESAAAAQVAQIIIDEVAK